MALQKLKTWYERYERPISSLALISGFVFDAITLKRVDLFWENLWVGAHLVVAALAIIGINVYENQKQKIRESWGYWIHFWLIIIIQFSFGGLLSTFLVFYFRSATLVTSWPFLLLLAVVFACNELLKKHYTRLIFQVVVLYISMYSFAIYIVPVIFHEISERMFLISGAVSLGAIVIFVIALWIIARERFRESQTILVLSVFGIFVLMNILYFTNLIPPIPLSLKDSGVYHSLSRDASGNYVGTYEPGTWIDYFKPGEDVHMVVGKPIYIYTAIFSPTNISTKIYHVWEVYDERRGAWVTLNTVSLDIVGGRDGGYRTYSFKSAIFPGAWRVNVETERGTLIGRVRFDVSTTSAALNLATTTLE